ncbi:uncharacterized protein LOC120341588 [Styela clava]
MTNEQVICGGGLIFALILSIISISTPGWIYYDSTIPSTNKISGYSKGLFYSINSEGQKQEILKGDAEKVAMAFLIMADIIILCGIVASGMSAFDKNDKKRGRVGALLALLAGVFIMTGMACYTGIQADSVESARVDWGYSFALGWTSMCVCILSGILGLMV